MNHSGLSQQMVQELQSAPSVVLVLPPNPEVPHVGASLGLFLSLRQTGKNVEIACPTPMLVEANRFVGVQEIKTKLSGRNLVISFDYTKDAIEKVSYNVDTGKFNLVVSPKSGHAPLDHTSVSYSYSGAVGDIIICVGAVDEKTLKELLPFDDPEHKKTLMLQPETGRSLVSETAYLVSALGIAPDLDAVNNLFHALTLESDRFVHASAEDFETAAALVRAGASMPETLYETPVAPSAPPMPTATLPQDHRDWLQQPKIFSSRAGT